LVEEEPSLRDLVRSILEKNGYVVIEAASGNAAVSLWQAQARQIQLVITDIVLSDGVNGHDLARKLQSERPGLAVLFASSYAGEIAPNDLVLEEGVNFLCKPYAPHQLLEAVSNALAARQARGD
jgi:CheY-like chemotaxis protein